MNDSEYFSNGKPVHRLSYCAFLDVLGFSDRVHASYGAGNEDELLESFHQILSQSITKLKSNVDESMLYFKSFTDNVVVAHPQISPDMESEFGFILSAINEYQFEMAQEGFFIRGGLAVEALFIDEDSVYGEALLIAHHLESSIAVNPIVVVCDSTAELIDTHVSYYASGLAPQIRDVLKGPDGRYFLNYLTESILEDEGEIDAVALNRHKEQIELGLNDYAAIPRVFSKFSWLAAYHNYFCDSVSEMAGYEESLKILPALTSVQFQTIA